MSKTTKGQDELLDLQIYSLSNILKSDALILDVVTKVSAQTFAKRLQKRISAEKNLIDFLILLTENILYWFWTWRF